MPDVFSKAKRSEVMSRIRSHGNKDTELRLRAVFRANGITGWRRQIRLRAGRLKVERTGGGKSKADSVHQRSTLHHQLTVRPDFVFRRERVAVFVDGCFWHGCAEHYRRPKGNRKFWDAKIARNMARDATVTKALRKAGWRVLRLWEHELTKKREKRLLARLRRWLMNDLE